MAPTPQWVRAHNQLKRDITKASRRARSPFRDINDLINTKQRYPELIPLLIDWLKTPGKKSGLTDPAELNDFREGLYRALTTIDAMGTEAVPLLFDSFHLDPPHRTSELFAAANALSYLAVPSDYDRMRRRAGDRTLSSGRSPIFEWLLRHDPDDALPLAITELEDPTVRPHILRALRAVKHLPDSIRPAVAAHLDDPDGEVRKQAKRTIAKLDRQDTGPIEAPRS